MKEKISHLFFFNYFSSIAVTMVHEDSDPIYQPLRSGRIWHKVSF